MKNAVTGLGILLISVVTIVIIFSVYGHNTRENELSSSLNIAVEQTLESLKSSPQGYTKETLSAELTENIIGYVESDSEVSVNILKVDIKYGLIDVEVTETYNGMLGIKQKVSVRKTAILDSPVDKRVNYSIVFINDNSVYKTYNISEGTKLFFPEKEPKKNGYEFVGWSEKKLEFDQLSEGDIVNMEEGTYVANKNTVYYAVYKPIN